MASFLERLRSRFICIKYVQTDNAEEHMELKEGLLQNTEGLKRFLHGYQAGIEIKVYMEYLEQTKTRKELQDFYSYSFELWGLSGIVKSTIFASIKGVSIFVLK